MQVNDSRYKVVIYLMEDFNSKPSPTGLVTFTFAVNPFVPIRYLMVF